MTTHLEQNSLKAFLPKGAPQLDEYRRQLMGVLESANILIIEDSESLALANCSIHLLGNEYGVFNTKHNMSDDEYWFKKACEQNAENKLFRIFIWQPPAIQTKPTSLRQMEFINSIRNNLYQNMTFSNHHSPVMFVEDIRSIIFSEQKEIFNTKPADVFFIYNEIDEDFGNGIIDLLNDVVNVEKLSISLNQRTDYSELIAQQIQESQLTTIYFNRTASWAVPFTKQVWKKIGGASANKDILMIGDAEQEQNRDIVFDVPNVTNLIAGTELIPLETKVFYDNMINKR